MVNEPLSGTDLEFAEAISTIVGTSDLPKTAGIVGTPAENAPLTKKAEKDPIVALLSMGYEDLFKNADFRQGVMDELETSREDWEPTLVEYWAALTGQ